MAQLQIPVSIWLSSTPQERDGFYLAAGFDPNLPVIDNGTDSTTVRFRQDPAASPAALTAAPVAAGAVTTGLQAGDDLRDFQPVSSTGSLTGDNPVTDEFGVPVAGAALAIAGRALRLIMGGGGGRLLAATWNSLPSIARSALTQIGIGVGALIAFNGDIPFITLPGQGTSVTPFVGPPVGPNVDIQIDGIGGHGPMGHVTVVGSWNTNPANPSQGVTFYRLSNGWLAVQNKKGRWKTWKPKKPIVIYADGARNLKTLLKADKAIDKQAKKLDKMLNRRRPRPRKAPEAPKPIIIEAHSRRVD